MSILVCVNPGELQYDRVFWDMWAKYFCDFSAILEEHLKSVGMEIHPFLKTDVILNSLLSYCFHPPTLHRPATKQSQEWNVILFLPEHIVKDHIIGLEFRMGRAAP